jgi:hypothetical protein
LTVIAFLGAATEAFAVHARPKAGSPITIKLVPAFEECFGANMVHGAPLSVPSCNPPLQSSSYLTMNAPDRPAPFTSPANGTATLTMKVSCLTPGTTTETGEAPACPATGDQIDVKMSFSAGDIRCVGVAGQGSCTSGAGSLYNGKLLLDIVLRITDHYNGIVPNPAGADCSDTTSCPATTNFPVWPIGVQCTSGSCNYVTSVDLAVPGAVPEAKRMVIEMGAVEVQDAGLNGNLTPAPAPASGACPPACQQDDAASLYLTQGINVP